MNSRETVTFIQTHLLFSHIGSLLPQSEPITTPTETRNEPRELPPSSKRIKVLPLSEPLICKNSQEPLIQVSTRAEIISNHTPINIYASYLKSVYKRQKFPNYRKWPPSPSKRYINLAVVMKGRVSKEEADDFTRATIHGDIDDIVHKKGSISMAQIATTNQRGVWPKFILVEGAPGVGKSTFSWKICRKWSKGKILQHYRLVVLLRLREKKVGEARIVSDLFRYYNDEIQQKVVHEIVQSGGRGVLLLIEGFDELPTNLRTRRSLFLDIIRGEVLSEATVLVTSRPSATGVLYEESISQHIEIVGFTSDNVQSYLESTLGSDPSLLSGIQKYLECYPHIRSIMYVPLNSVIVTEVYRTSRKDKSVVPKTKTELYSSLIRSLLLRYLHDHPVYGEQKWRICSFSDLPPVVYKQLCELSRIAYEGIVRDQQVIFSDLSDDFETLGLMQCVPELYVDEGAAVSHNFLHLTVQEYLAALHLSQQPVGKQMKHFIDYKKEPRRWSHFKMVLLFLAGLTQFNAYSTDYVRMLVCESESDEDSSGIVSISLDALHWIFESQDTILDSSVLGSSLVRFGYAEMAPFDCFVLGYCISHSNCSWNISLVAMFSIGDEGVEMLVRGTLERCLQFTGSISHLNMCYNDISSEGLKYLLKLPNELLGGRLEELDLGSNQLDSESCRLLSHSIPAMTSLKSLNLYGNPIGNGESVPLIRSLCALNYFRELKLGRLTRLGVEDCRTLSELLSSSTSLEELHIDYNHLPPEAVQLIISGLHHNTGLKVLVMDGSKLSTETCVSLTTILRQNNSLVELGVSLCSIGSEGASHLADALRTNDTLQTLGMNHNPIGDKGATAFSEMLTHNKSLKALNLCDDSIGEEGARHLADALRTNDTLQTLGMNHNPIGDKGATAFSEMLTHNKSLKALNLCDDSIGEEGARHLADALRTNDTLQTLGMNHNPIGDKGATLFSEMLTHNKSLKVLNLTDDSISEEGTRKLITSLTHNTTLETLLLPVKYHSHFTSSGEYRRVKGRIRWQV